MLAQKAYITGSGHASPSAMCVNLSKFCDTHIFSSRVTL